MLYKDAMDRQILAAAQRLRGGGEDSNSAAGMGDMEKQLVAVLKNLEESFFVTLHGSYNIWQEVHSANVTLL